MHMQKWYSHLEYSMHMFELLEHSNTVFTLQKLRTVTVLEPFHGTVPVPFTLFVVNQNHACAEKNGRGKNGRGRRSARTLILKL